MARRVPRPCHTRDDSRYGSGPARSCGRLGWRWTSWSSGESAPGRRSSPNSSRRVRSHARSMTSSSSWQALFFLTLHPAGLTTTSSGRCRWSTKASPLAPSSGTGGGSPSCFLTASLLCPLGGPARASRRPGRRRLCGSPTSSATNGFRSRLASRCRSRRQARPAPARHLCSPTSSPGRRSSATSASSPGCTRLSGRRPSSAGRVVDAARWFRASLELARDSGYWHAGAFGMMGTQVVAYVRGQSEAAARLYGVLSPHLATLRRSAPPEHLRTWEGFIAAVRDCDGRRRLRQRRARRRQPLLGRRHERGDGDLPSRDRGTRRAATGRDHDPIGPGTSSSPSGSWTCCA